MEASSTAMVMVSQIAVTAQYRRGVGKPSQSVIVGS